MAVDALPILLMAMVLVSVPAAVQSHACASEKFDFCKRLPTLRSRLHYTYNATNASLSIAFVATPSKPGGWISWSINPTKTGMVGAQSFIAYELNGTLLTKTLNIAGYHEFHPGNLSFPYWDVSAEKTKDEITLYASLAVPGNKTVLNQVWQVGPGAGADRKIQAHGFDSESLQSKSVLSLTGASAPAPAPAPLPVRPAPGKSSSGVLNMMKVSGEFDFALISSFIASLVTLCLL